MIVQDIFCTGAVLAFIHASLNGLAFKEIAERGAVPGRQVEYEPFSIVKIYQ